MYQLVFGLAIGLSWCGESTALGKSLEKTTWRVHETDNFRVFTTAALDATAAAARCEELRSELACKWIGEEVPRWSLPCCVVFHPSQASYLRAVGEDGRQTLGCSTVTCDGEATVARRIDLRGDQRNPLRAALPHEMTHVVLAELVAEHNLATWVDEGLAVLADTPDKQGRHVQALHQAIRRGKRVSVALFWNGQQALSADDRATFYAHSASLTAFLVKQAAPTEFLRFSRLAASGGYDAALRSVYSIDGVKELERRWLQQVRKAA